MAGTFKFGAVIKWDGFTFPDGGASDKLLVILGAKQGQSVIAILTTSKARLRPQNPGCQSHYEFGSYYYIPGGMKDSFRADTWVELYRPQEISRVELDKRIAGGEVHVVFNLAPNTAAGIRNCLKQSPDVTAYQISLLE